MTTPSVHKEFLYGSGKTVLVPSQTVEQMRDYLLSPRHSARRSSVFWSAAWVQPGVSADYVRYGMRALLGSYGLRDRFDLHALPDERGFLIVAAPGRKGPLPRAYRAARLRELQAEIERAAAGGEIQRLRGLCDERAALEAAVRGAAPIVFGTPGRPRKVA